MDFEDKPRTNNLKRKNNPGLSNQWYVIQEREGKARDSGRGREGEKETSLIKMCKDLAMGRISKIILGPPSGKESIFLNSSNLWYIMQRMEDRRKSPLSLTSVKIQPNLVPRVFCHMTKGPGDEVRASREKDLKDN